MFDFDFSALDAPATLATAAEAREVSDRAEVAVLQSAAQWADLHSHLDEAASGRSFPGTERLVRLGGAGTPAVAELAAAELGAVLRMLAGEVRPWLARKTADSTRHVSVEVADVVDRRVARWAHAVSLGRLDAMVHAAIIAAGPDGAAAEVAAAEEAHGVWLSQSNDHGVKSIHSRTQAPNAIWFDASIQRVADSLELFGDKSSLDVRRARAVGILAQPQQALDLIDQTVRLTVGDPGSVRGQSGVTGVPARRRAGTPPAHR